MAAHIETRRNRPSKRHLSAPEKRLLEFLIAQPQLLGHDEFRQQVDLAEVAEEFKDGEMSVRFSLPDQTPAASLPKRMVVSAFGDEDGVPVEVLLHVIDGSIDELEVLRADSGPLKQYPDPASLNASSLG